MNSLASVAFNSEVSDYIPQICLMDLYSAFGVPFWPRRGYGKVIGCGKPLEGEEIMDFLAQYGL